MNKYTYQELTEKVNAHFKDNVAAHVTERTLRFWINDGILPKPKGAGRCWHFEEDHFQEIISIRKLQSSYGQSIEDIKRINILADKYLNPSDSKFEKECHFNLSKVVSALESVQNLGINPVPDIESFKKHKMILIKDYTYSPPYRFIDKDKYQGSYVEEDGIVYRVLETLPDLDVENGYFTIEQIEEYLSMINEKSKSNLKTFKHFNIKSEAEETRSLIADGIMNTPHYRFKGENYFSSRDLFTYDQWKDLLVNYGFGKGELKLLRKRIEFDIENYFYKPEEGVSIESSLFYKFQRQVVLFNDCLLDLLMYLFGREKLIASHTIEDSKNILRDYLDGFLFMCNSFVGTICLKKTPIERLSAKQIKTGLSQGKFAHREIEKVLRVKEVEVKAVKSILKQVSKGSEHGKND